MIRACVALGRWLCGAVLCMFGLGAVLVAGWSLRVAQREAVREWVRRSDQRLPAFAAADPQTAHLARWPRLLLSVWPNATTGLAALANTWLLTGPAIALWVLGWRFGWEASFSKAVDAAGAGPLAALLGIVLYVVALLHLPAAQARQAATGSWRRFWDLSLGWRVVARRPGEWVALVAAWAALSLPVTLMWMIPVFAGPVDVAAARAWLDGYFAAWCLVLFPAYVGLRAWAGRWYARALVDAVRDGAVSATELHPFERSVMGRIGLLRTRPVPRAAVSRWIGAVGRLAAIGAAALLWLGLSLQVFVGNFFHYRPVVGFSNQPLVHAPLFKHVPESLP